MGSTGALHDRAVPLAEEEQLRAHFYGLLAKFLSEPPASELLAAAGKLKGDDTPLGSAITKFARVCQFCDPAAAGQEYQDLFIGLGRGELLPYGSFYLTGFLHEKPLARLREDMAELGFEKKGGVSEPEDHAASVLEMMAGLIDGRFGRAADARRQKKFFNAHVVSWMPVFFQDLQSASSSTMYATLADVALQFLAIETDALQLE